MRRIVQGFGYRPIDDLSASADGRCPESLQGRNPRGAGLAVCYLWGFAGAASWVGAALAVVMGDGPTIGVGILSPRRPLAGCFWHDRGRHTRPGRPPVNSAAMPEARVPGKWVVRWGGDGGHGIAVLTPVSG